MKISATLDQIVKHFTILYADELQYVTPDTIFEWWSQTKDQYDDVNYEDVEKAILNAI
jgi:hypothetical protein